MIGRERGQRSKRRVGSRNHSQVFGNGKSTGTDEFLIGTLRAKTRRWADASRAPALQTPLTLATAAARALTAAFGAAAPARTARSILAKFMHSLGSTCGFPLNQSPEGFVAARTALEINEGEFQPRDPSAKASGSERKHSRRGGRNGAPICATITPHTSARKSDTKTPRSAHATGRKDFTTAAAQRTRVPCRCPGIVRRYWQSCPPSPNPCGCISDTAARRPPAARSSSPRSPT